MTDILEKLRGLSRVSVIQLFALVGILGVVAWRSCVLKFCVIDPDIWWHLKVGDWILANFALPNSGIFSRTAASVPWVAYSWGYEVLLSLAYRWAGIFGVGIFGVALTVGVACAIMYMLRRISGSFWIAFGLSAVAYYSMLFTMMPRPHFISIGFFAVVLTKCFEAQRSSNVASLDWLPLIFLVWANLHIQFVYGLLLFGLFVVINLAQNVATEYGFWSRNAQLPILSSRPLVVLLAISVVATLIGPNTYHLYKVIYDYSRSTFGYLYIRELQALDFRFAEHFGQLLLTGAAFFAVGWQRKTNPFKLAMLIFCAIIAYRTTRDGWFICIPAAACIADVFYDSEGIPERMHSLIEQVGVLVVLSLLIALMLPNVGFTSQDLDSAVRSKFPVDAIDYLHQHPAPGPIYNSFNWGGFLIWDMPDYPVAIDGRNDLYGDAMDQRFMGVQNGLKSYADDPDFRQSGFILLNGTEYLTTRLSRDPNYRMIYRDRLAVVYVPQSRGPSDQ